MVLQPVARQHHDGARHAGYHMPGDHRPTRRAVIDKHPRAGGLEPQNRLFAGVDQRQRPAAKRACSRVKVDVVLHHVFGRVEQGQFDIIAFMHHHQRPGDRAIKGHRLNPGIFVHLHLFLDDLHLELDDRGAFCRHLVMRVDKGRSCQLDLAARQAGQIDRCRTGCVHHLFGVGGLDGFDGKRGGGHQGRAHQCCASREHLAFLIGVDIEEGLALRQHEIVVLRQHPVTSCCLSAYADRARLERMSSRRSSPRTKSATELAGRPQDLFAASIERPL